MKVFPMLEIAMRILLGVVESENVKKKNGENEQRENFCVQTHINNEKKLIHKITPSVVPLFV